MRFSFLKYAIFHIIIHFYTFVQIHVRAQHWYSSYFIETMINARNVPSKFGYVFLKG